MAWDRIRGQDAARDAVLGAAARSRLGQSYLLVGPDGVGKRLFARELTKALLCENAPSPMTACDRCPACAQVTAESHPDVLVLRTPDDKLELPVELMRTFCARFALKPTRGGRKVGIVETADDFNDESANSFLKTLEEPPPGGLLLLIGTSTDRQLPTILSRCQLVRFAPLAHADLCAVLSANGVEDATKRDRLARLGAGSAARALALTDDAIWELRQKLVEGLTGPRPAFQPLAELWTSYLDDAGKDKGAEQRARASLVLQFLIEAVGRALKLAHGADIPGADATELARLKAFAERTGPDSLLDLLDRCVEADRHIERRVQLALIVDSVVEQFTRRA
jgi:DNA polymerase-3 subunit delta'